MSILTNFNTGHMKICHYREISVDAELVMLSILFLKENYTKYMHLINIQTTHNFNH
jgi:hypothetical protein